MFVTLQGENYTANIDLFLVIYLLNHEENSEKFESQFQCFLKFSRASMGVSRVELQRCSVAAFTFTGCCQRCVYVHERDVFFAMRYTSYYIYLWIWR